MITLHNPSSNKKNPTDWCMKSSVWPIPLGIENIGSVESFGRFRFHVMATFPQWHYNRQKKEPQWFSTIFGTSKNSSDVIRANMRCVTRGKKNNQSIFGSSVGLSHSFLSCPLRHFAFEIVMDRFWIYTTMMSNKFPSDCDGNPTDQNIDTSLELQT